MEQAIQFLGSDFICSWNYSPYFIVMKKELRLTACDGREGKKLAKELASICTLCVFIVLRIFRACVIRNRQFNNSFPYSLAFEAVVYAVTQHFCWI